MTGFYGYCDKRYEIQIKACGLNEYVYYLRKARSCNEGYCFGNIEFFNFIKLTFGNIEFFNFIELTLRNTNFTLNSYKSS